MTDRQGIKSSAALRETAGRDYAEWFGVLDTMAATTMPSKDVIRRLVGDHHLRRW